MQRLILLLLLLQQLTVAVCENLCLVRLGLAPRVAGYLHLVVFVQRLAQCHFVRDLASQRKLFRSVHEVGNSLVQGAQANRTIFHGRIFTDADRGSIALLRRVLVGGFRYLPIHILGINVVLVR